MAKGAKLKAALDRFQGVDHKLERQKKQQKEAEKKRRAKGANGADDEILEGSIAKAEKEVEEQLEVPKDAVALKEEKASKKRKRSAAPSPQDRQEVAAEDDESEASGEEWETDESENEGVNLDMIDDSEDSDSDEDDEDGGAELDEEEEEDIPMSDIESLASEDKGDIIPYQRLTINNTAALLKAHKSIALPSNLSFSQNQTITTDAPVEIPDIDDDLNRELAFYKQSLEAVTKARGLLKAEGVSFSRPTDYFAEMVKSDEHMGKIKQKLIDEAASKRASADARRQRDLKKFGKQVQVAKLQERDRAKRDTMEKINLLKRSTLDLLSPSYGLLTSCNRETRCGHRQC